MTAEMKKGLLIGLAAAALLLAASVGGGVFYLKSLQNSDRFLLGTVINGVDVSGKTAAQVEEIFAKRLLDSKTVVTEDNVEVLRFSLSEMGYAVDDEAVVKALAQCMDKEKEDFESVIKNTANGVEFRVDLPYSVDEDKFAEAVSVEALSAPRKENENAKILYYASDKECRILPEVQGTELKDEDLQTWLKGEIGTALKKSKDGGDIACAIPDSLYILPEKRAGDEKLQKKCALLNEYAGESVTYVFGDQKETLEFDTIMNWLKIRHDKVTVKEDKVTEYVRKLAEKYETRYKDRVFQTTWGGEVTFPATLNEYGYTILEDLEAAQLTEDILSGKSVEREPVYQYLGAWGDPLFLKRNGTDDLAGTYVEVSIGAQHMWYYINGELFIESDVVTGDTTLGQDTATGVFPLAFKQSPATLRGGEGKNKYETKVQYWMPFYEGQGLHDAWWKSVFGGTEYIGNGSHGCVNLPPEVAETVYYNIEPGTAIIIYY